MNDSPKKPTSKSVRPETKREKITQANSTMFGAVVLASVVIVFSLISMKFLWSKLSYNNRVISAKTTARDQVQTNLTNFDKLKTEYVSLDSSATTNSKTILHALPPNYDYAGLAAYLESLAQTSGVTLPGSIGDDASASAEKTAIVSKPVEIPLSFQVVGPYDNVVQFIKNTEHSIRPILITNVEYSGTNDKITAVISASSYYQPARDFSVGTEEIK